MRKRTVTPLPEGFVDAFEAKASYGIKKTAQTNIEMLEHDMRVINTKLMAARNGGAGNVASLHEDKLRLAGKIQEAKANRSADKAEGDTKTPNVEVNVKTPSGTAEKESPKRKGDQAQADSMEIVKEEVELDEAPQPKWKVQIGKKHYTVTARNTAEANTKAKKLATKDGNVGVGGKIERIAEEVEELDENKAIIKLYQDMKAQGKKDHNILDYIGSMPKYKKVSRDQMAKMIGDAKRKGVFKEEEAELEEKRKISPGMQALIDAGNKKADAVSKEVKGSTDRAFAAMAAKRKKKMAKEDVEITELHMSLLEAHGIEKKVAERVKKVFDAMSDADKAAFMKSYLKNPKAATEYMFKDMKKMAKEEVELDEALDSVDPKAVKKKFDDRKDKDLDNDGDTDSSDEYLHKRRKAISKALKKEETGLDEEKDTHKTKDGRTAKKGLWYNINKKKKSGEKPLPKGHEDRPSEQDFENARKTTKEEVKLDEAKLDASDFEAMDPPKGIDYDDKNLRKVNWKMYDDKTIRDIIKRAESSANERSPHGPSFQSSSKGYYQKIINAAKAELKKRGIKEEVVSEAKDDYTINHKTFSSAVQHALEMVKKRGFEVDDDEWDRKVAMGPRKPGKGKTNRYTIDLMKGGKETRRKLQMQVYYDEGRYELNMYVS